MKKQKSMSPIGFAIVTIILVAVGMIISAPMIVENQSGKNHRESNNERIEQQNREREFYERSTGENDSYSENRFRELENRFNDKIESLSRNIEKISESNISDKYVCSIQGGYDEQSGVVIPINPDNPPAKFVFVCEYKK